MSDQKYGLLENYRDLGVGIIEFALDDYVSTVKSLGTYYRKLDRCFEDGFKAKKMHQRMGDVCLDIFHRIQNLNDIEKFLTGDWVRTLTSLDVDMLFRETKRKLKKKGYKVGLMGLSVKSDDKGVIIFANEKEGDHGKYTLYSIAVSSKNKEGSWVNGYISCRFKNGVVVPNKAKIKINNAFYTVTKSGDKTYVSLMITDFDFLDSGESSGNAADEFIKIPDNVDEEVPFL